jgi:hypothetical protein
MRRNRWLKCGGANSLRYVRLHRFEGPLGGATTWSGPLERPTDARTIKKSPSGDGRNRRRSEALWVARRPGRDHSRGLQMHEPSRKVLQAMGGIVAGQRPFGSRDDLVGTTREAYRCTNHQEKSFRRWAASSQVRGPLGRATTWSDHPTGPADARTIKKEPCGSDPPRTAHIELFLDRRLDHAP